MKRTKVIEPSAPMRRQYEDGFWSFKHGVIVNPYNPATLQYREWQRGWNAAYFRNLERLTSAASRS